MEGEHFGRRLLMNDVGLCGFRDRSRSLERPLESKLKQVGSEVGLHMCLKFCKADRKWNINILPN